MAPVPVADLRTELSEIATGLGMLGHDSLPAALDARPEQVLNVPSATFDRLLAAVEVGKHGTVAAAAFANGRAFLAAPEGLRGRPPARVEWKGPDRPPGYDLLPADLRADFVYLVSCKYRSRVLMNASPQHLFDNLLQVRSLVRADDWYAVVAPDAYGELLDAVRRAVDPELPPRLEHLTAADRATIGRACARRWPAAVEAVYSGFCAAVATATARRWSLALPSLRQRELMLWRLLRLADSPYFVLGAEASGSVRLRIATPWDWRQDFRLEAFDIVPSGAGQPRVDWTATVEDRTTSVTRTVRGHVEIRWSHGRFCGVPEAKIYLDSPIAEVPGYYPLTAAGGCPPAPGGRQISFAAFASLGGPTDQEPT